MVNNYLKVTHYRKVSARDIDAQIQPGDVISTPLLVDDRNDVSLREAKSEARKIPTPEGYQVAYSVFRAVPGWNIPVIGEGLV